MSSTPDGGPAFPRTPGNPGTAIEGWRGMSLRDYFAAKAMQGLISGLGVDDEYEASKVATLAYELADSMLQSRQRGEGDKQ